MCFININIFVFRRIREDDLQALSECPTARFPIRAAARRASLRVEHSGCSHVPWRRSQQGDQTEAHNARGVSRAGAAESPTELHRHHTLQIRRLSARSTQAEGRWGYAVYGLAVNERGQRYGALRYTHCQA